MSGNNNELHLDRINRVIDYIDQHLDMDLSLSILADIALLSPFHFHRIFTTTTGETLHGFVQRKRLERIAQVLLSHREIPIRELALKYGFDNPASFSRAFRKFYGMSASELKRLKKGTLNKLVRRKSKIGKEVLTIEEYISNTKAARDWMKKNTAPEICQIQEVELAYVRNQGAFEEVYQAFGKLKTWVDQTDVLVGKQGEWLMVIHDSPSVTEEHRMMQSAAIRVDQTVELGPGIGKMVIPSGKYLIGHFTVSDKEFKNAWDGMTVYIIDNEIQTREGFYFERFSTDSLFNPGQKHQLEICIPIL